MTPAGKPALLHEFFFRAAGAWPDRMAVEVPPGRGRPERAGLTYGALASRAHAVAAAIAPLAAADLIVAVMLPRTAIDAFAAPLGILEAGAAWLPIDPAFPDARIREILDDSRAVALVTDTAGAARLTQAGPLRPPILDVARIDRSIPPGPPDPPRGLTPASLAYVIYTSGTSGRPKGVMIEHGAVANLVAGDLATFRLTARDRCAQGSSHAYDSAVEETWLAFAAGATLVVLDDEAARSGPDLVSWLERERITVFCPPPTQLRTMGCRTPAETPRALSLLYAGGEPLPQDLADIWAPGRRFINGYGPTEGTVTAIRGPVEAGVEVSIGRPVPGVSAWILDSDLEPVPDGTSGELCLGGAGLARGYLNAPDLTAAAFVEHPRLGRLYRTGDRARRTPQGMFVHEGRLDAQVKLRGYRIELEEIEARLAALPGVRAAGCRLAGQGARASLVAFVVPEDAAAPPAPAALRGALAGALPAYMVPSAIGVLDALPLTAGGKLDRAALPEPDGALAASAPAGAPPASDLERRLAAAAARALRRPDPVPRDADFFRDLGGDSLAAAEFVTALRDDPRTAAATVRDVYEAPAIGALAARLERASPATASASATSDRETPSPPRRAVRPARAAVFQAAWLAIELGVAAAVAAWILFVPLPPALMALGLIPSLLLAPLAMAAIVPVYAAAATLLAVATKRVLIGRYTPRRAPVWSAFYLRHWVVQRAARRIPWRLIGGTVFELAVLRALGARVGRRVHVHRGVDLGAGGWDLLEIGDDATIGQDAALRVVDLADGELVIAPIRIGRGATIDVRAGVDGGAMVEDEGWLAPLSSLAAGARVPAGERWDGVPARPAGRVPAPPQVDAGSAAWPAIRHGIATMAAKLGVALALVAPLEVVAVLVTMGLGADAASLVGWVFAPAWHPRHIGAILAIGLLPQPLRLALQAALARAIGPVPTGVIDRWSPAYIRVWIKTDLVRSAGDWLSGSLFWPMWLRAAGMRIGRGSEISTIIDVIPEHITIGAECFFADGIYLGGPIVSRGRVTTAPTSFGANVFLGNHAVVPAGQAVPDDVLIGVSTVAGDRAMRRGTSWFGHPPFELSRRPIEGWDRRLTHDPTPVRYFTRIAWEAGRAAIPFAMFAVEVGWLTVVGGAMAHGARWGSAVVAPVAGLAADVVLAGGVLALKWMLLGRVRPGEHPLWSCWCSRWDFLYLAWARLARQPLSALEGTPLLIGYLRAMGARIGRGVVLGPGFAQVVDPDMLHLEDGVTVHALFQAHTFEDRVLKIDHLWHWRNSTVHPGAVVFDGADVGAGATVAPHSVVMKRERLLAGRTYEGCPVRPV